MSKLILVRHGQSEWNLANRFTGWWDVDLTEKVYHTICFVGVQVIEVHVLVLSFLLWFLEPSTSI